MKKLILLFPLLVLFLSCKKDIDSQKKENKTDVDTTNITFKNDSIALVELTKKLLQWAEKDSEGDFNPLENKSTESAYSEIDMALHKKRLKELKNTNLFSKDFIANYDKIALKIDSEFKNGTLKWNVGELPPFGFGASPWCNCQDFPNDFLTKTKIKDLEINNNKASYDWGFGPDDVYSIKAVKENDVWKISYMQGFDYNGYVSSFQQSNDFTGKWQNGMVSLNIGDTSLAFEYHGQCVYFYPIRKISDTEFEMIWSNEMDCKFDNGTSETFGLKEVPQIGKPFSKITLRNNVLHVQYYYKDWVAKYSDQITDVFTSEYSKVEEDLE
ncbi:hypothetical protein ACFSJW_06980 [Flavobacterium artemisiae]|uniref:DUF4348 domain-containing protein n=1 Tax=Flavobacterium artemisiae TaxID=2126556 RepID=A0ABW4HCV4_9FLAO